MNDFESTVAEVIDDMTTEQPADDAQAAGITAEEVINGLFGGEETAESEGDGGHRAAKKQDDGHQEKDDKFSRRMRAALASQRKQLYAELGGSEEEIRDIIRAHRAKQLSTENPQISPEAAKMIVEEREKAQAAKPQNGPDAAVIEAVQSLIDEGWTREELTAFVQDEIALEQINVDGVSIRRAAMDFFRRYKNEQNTAQRTESERRRGVPTVRKASTSPAQGRNPIEEMSDEEFAKFSARMEKEMLSGRKIRL